MQERTVLVLVMLVVGVAQARIAFRLFTFDEFTPSKARDYRAAARYHFTNANEAQRKMEQAQEDNDVEAYEKWRDVMREEGKKMFEAIDNYDEVRDYLEAKIWQQELHIDGFELAYEKGTLPSLFDHVTGRAQI